MSGWPPPADALSWSMLRSILPLALLLTACADPGGEGGKGEGEGEGDAGEGEGDAGEGEGEGDAGAGEGEGVVEGEIAVLLIGNSQLGFFSNPPQPPDVTRALEDFAATAYDGATTLLVDRFQQAGTGCDGFFAAGTGPGSARERAGSGEYDVVILLPGIGEGAADADCWDQFRVIAEDAGSRFGIMATAHVSGAYPAGFDAMDAAMRSYAATNGSLFIPAGSVWRRVLGDAVGNARFEFYGGDDAHPGGEGSYLYVLALYGALSGRPVLGLAADSEPLRCLPDQSCLSYAALDACVDDQNLFHCAAQNGALFDGNGQPTFITATEAEGYQRAVDDVLAEVRIP